MEAGAVRAGQPGLPVADVSPRRRAAPRRGGAIVASGVVWIVGVAVLLAGVVAVNVSVLRLNVQVNQLDRDRADLEARNAELRSRLSSAAATGRIQRLARNRLGLVPADPSKTVYVSLAGRK